MKGLSPETRSLLERGRGETLEPEHRARLKRSVLAGAVGLSVAATTFTTSWAATAAKLAVALVLVGGATALVATGASTRSEHSASSPTQSVRPVPVGNAPGTSPISIPPPPDPAPTPTERPVVAPATAASPTPSAATRPSPTPEVEVPNAISALQEENLLVREAKAALENGDVSRALALTEEHARRFPHGTLLPEGSEVHILSLCKAGRLGQARSEATTFLAAHPEGPLSRNVRSSCGGSP